MKICKKIIKTDENRLRTNEKQSKTRKSIEKLLEIHQKLGKCLFKTDEN